MSRSIPESDRPRVTDDRVTLGNGYQLSECVTAAGERQVWLLDPADNTNYGGPRIPAHEQTGPLPPGAQAAITTAFSPAPLLDDPYRCAATATTTGIRCQSHAKPGSRYCGIHARRLGNIR